MYKLLVSGVYIFQTEDENGRASGTNDNLNDGSILEQSSDTDIGADNNAAIRTMGIQSLGNLLDSQRTFPPRPGEISNQTTANQQPSVVGGATFRENNQSARQVESSLGHSSAAGGAGNSGIIHASSSSILVTVPPSPVRTESVSVARPSPTRIANNSPRRLNSSINEFRSPKRRRISSGGKVDSEVEVDEEAEVSMS